MRIHWGWVAVALASCQGQSDVSRSSRSVQIDRCNQVEIPWGQADGTAGYAIGREDRQAMGPASIAIADDGRTLIVDALERRVLSVRGNAVETVLDDIARDVEDISLRGDTVALYSPLRAAVELRSLRGEHLGSMVLPRAIRAVTAIEIGESNQLTIATAMQERIDVGSPALPQVLDAALHTRREGAMSVAGRSIATRATDGGVELVVLGEEGSRTTIADSFSLGNGTAAMLVGSAGNAACAKVETVDSADKTVSVDRRLVCLDVPSGEVTLDRPLPSTGTYLPRREVAVAGNARGLRTATMTPTDSGLIVETCEVSR